MKIVPASVAFMIAVSLAVFPLSRGVGHVLPQQSAAALDSGCCDKSEPCEKKTNDCGSTAACVLKCSSLPGAMAAPVTVQAVEAALLEPARLSAGFISPSDNPPLPPPRL
jgi:hypothetical protein